MATDITPKRHTLPLENEKFATNANGKTVVRTEDESLEGIGGLLNGIKYDAVSVAYPNTTTETYTFYEGGLGGTLKATITLIYTNSSKTNLSSAVRT